MTETILPPEVVKALKPEFITPFGCEALCRARKQLESGGLYEVGAGWISKLQWERTQGAKFNPSEGFSAEDVADNWDQISDFTDAEKTKNRKTIPLFPGIHQSGY